MVMRFKALVTQALCLCGAAFVGLAYAHPARALHTGDLVRAFEGYEAFYDLASEINAKIDTFELDGVRLPPRTHRRLFHPLLFGESIPKEELDSICASYIKQVQQKNGITLSVETAKRKLMEARARYIRECIGLVQEKTGLPRRQAQALAGSFHIAHLLGDADPLDNTLVDALPEVNRLSRALERHLDELFRGGSDEVLAWVRVQKETLRELRKLYANDPVGHNIALRRLLAKDEFGGMLNRRWGRTLAKHNIHFNEAFAKQCFRESEALYYSEGRLRKQKLLDNPRRFAKSGLKSHANTTYKTTRRLNRARQAALAKTASKESSVVIRPGVLQTMRSSTGKVVEVLTVPVQQVGKGLAAGGGVGILTFVFSQGATYAMYQSGALSDDAFIAETEKNCGSALVAGTTTFVLVALGANPAGWVVIGVGVTADVIYGLAFDEIQWVQSFSWDHDWIFGEVPTEIQRRKKFLEGQGPAIFTLPDRTVFLDVLSNSELEQRTSPLDWSRNAEIQKRVSPLDWSASEEIRSRKTLF